MKLILLDMGEGFSIIAKALLGIEGVLILISLIIYKVLYKRKHRSLLAALGPFIIALLFLEGRCCYAYLMNSIVEDFGFLFAFKLALILSAFPMFIIFVISFIRNVYGGNQKQ